MRGMTAARAYQASAAHRSLRDQEADVFRRATAALRLGQTAGEMPRVKALADNGRLWLTLIDALRDPDNKLPAPLRASLISVGLAVQREADAPNPDFGFLININEQIAAGLSGA